MDKIKEKAKGFWDNYKYHVIMYGSAILIGTGVGVYLSKSYNDGLVDGVYMGMHAGFAWADENLGTNNVELYDAWAKANQDQIVHRVGRGKWA